MRLVNENGGTYHSAFRSTLVDIVITEKDKTNSDKYKAAVRFKKDILCPEWIFDSVQKGFSLPTKTYQVKSLKVSTPTKRDGTIHDFSQLTDISRISSAGGGNSSNVNDTVATTMDETQQANGTFVAPAPVTTSTSKGPKRDAVKKPGSGDHYRLIYEDICPKAAKKAGSFLDGCCIYLSGFRTEEREKLNRILNVGGATRYDVVNEKITHIIVGQLDDKEYRTWKKDGLLKGVNIVRLDWLLQSIKLKQPANEAVYRVSLPASNEPDAPSPSSKRTLRSMNQSFKQPDKSKKKLFETSDSKETTAPETPVTTKLPALTPLASSTEMPNFEEDEQNLIAQYSQENVPIAEVPSRQDSSHKTISNETLVQPIASSTLNMVCPQVGSAKPASPPVQPKATGENNITETALSVIDYDNLNFFQGMSLYIDRDHYPEEFYSQMISECEAAQGNVVSKTFKDLVDYAIVSFERTLDVSKLPVKARHIITELYVESCLKQNKLVPIEYYHKHIPHTADAQPLKSMTIVVSLYAGLERDFIDSISQLLGANVNKTFVKKEKPLLVCPKPEGSKYEGALKWGYPVVTSDWLVQCSLHGTKLSYQDFLVGDSPADFPISPTLRERNTTNTPNRAEPPSFVSKEINALENQTDFTPLRNKRVSELAGGPPAKSSPESPHTPLNNYARPTYNFDHMEAILAGIEDEGDRQCIREIIDEIRNNQTPELERIRRQACTPVNRKLPTPKGIPDFCTTPEFQKRMADALERRWRLPTKKLKPDTPIEEIRKRVLRATCESMGIPYIDDDSDNERPSTSFSSQKKCMNIHQPTSKPLQNISALASNTPVANKTSRNASHTMPRSIFSRNSPQKLATRPSDTFVPNTQTPPHSMQGDSPSSASLSSMGMGKQASLFGKSSINFDKISFEETTTVDAASSTRRRPSEEATVSPEIKQITDYLKNCESRRQSLKRPHGSDDQRDHNAAARNVVETETQQYVQPFESEQFGMGTEEMVGWRDPAEFGRERRSRAVPSMQFKGIPRFSISCSDEGVRNEVIQKILQLGGTVSENLVNFDPQCSHFICERPNRGEKILGCISSGKWILSLKYIEECHAKDVFIDEELYEWGNCKALNLPQLSQEEQVIAQAAHRWRKELSGCRDKGAFSGFRVILRLSERNIDALKNVIKAGKGCTLDVSSPYSKNAEAQRATHCFVDVKKMPLTKDDYEYLSLHNVKIFSQMYINAYLMHGTEVDTVKYEIMM